MYSFIDKTISTYVYKSRRTVLDSESPGVRKLGISSIVQPFESFLVPQETFVDSDIR